MPRITRSLTRPVVLAALVIGSGAAAFAGTHSTASRDLLGDEVAVGHGSARTFIDLAPDGTPTAIGILLTEAALEGLATHMNTTSRCWDKDGNGLMSHGECIGDDQVTLALPPGADRVGLPFKWAMLNWNAEGHVAPAPPVWGAPHFDFHFYLADPELIHGIRPGPCGEYIDCGDFEIATRPLPPQHLPEDYIDVGAAVPAMGNHLIDATDPELADPSLGFSKTFIYGVYDGRVIFLEPMVSHAYLSTKPNDCAPVKVPASYAVSGYYPTQHCVRYDPGSATYRVSLEGMVKR